MPVSDVPHSVTWSRLAKGSCLLEFLCSPCSRPWGSWQLSLGGCPLSGVCLAPDWPLAFRLALVPNRQKGADRLCLKCPGLEGYLRCREHTWQGNFTCGVCHMCLCMLHIYAHKMFMCAHLCTRVCLYAFMYVFKELGRYKETEDPVILS